MKTQLLKTTPRWLAVPAAFFSLALATPPMNAAEPDPEPTRTLAEWVLLGPFPNPPASARGPMRINRAGWWTDYLQEIGGEAEAKLSPGMTVRWEPADGSSAAVELSARTLTVDGEGVADIASVLGELSHRTAYLYTELEEASGGPRVFFLGSDDGARIWVNGELVHESWAPGGKACRPREEFFSAQLRPGTNRILVKVDQVRGGWGVCIERVEPEAAPSLLADRAAIEATLQGTTAEAEGWFACQLRVGLNLPETWYPGSLFRATLRSTSPGDPQVIEGELGSTITVHVPAGLFSVEVLCDDLAGRELRSTFGFHAGEGAEQTIQALLGQAQELAEAPGHSAGAGWMLYLVDRIRQSLGAGGEAAPEALERACQLAWWVNSQAVDPEAWSRQRGSIEWAYRSRIDGSGQPFTLNIPDGYSPDRPWPLLIYLHGAGGSHGERWGNPHPSPIFELFPDGRGRVGGYVGNSGADVLEALAFVREHWRIDPEAIHLSGGSMGGFGSFTLGTRHPDLFASVIPWCGGGVFLPVENLHQTPVFALHSDDDWVVPSLLAVPAMERINAVGGHAIMALATGYGHGIGSWAEGHELMAAWRDPIRRQSPREIRQILYEAVDGGARGAWWASVSRWGARPSEPARFHLRVGSGNTLSARLSNVGELEIDLESGPIDPSLPLRVSVEGGVPLVLDPPLPARVHLRQGEGAWTLEDRAGLAPEEPLPWFPGGLYDGQPILIVWGTGGTPEETAALNRLAKAGRKASRLSWTENTWAQTRWGELPIRPDHDVTPEDLANHHLFLLGTPAQNSVVDRLMAHFPASWRDGRVYCHDGRTLEMTGRGLLLCAANPENPQRRISWIASESPAFYEPDAPWYSLPRWATTPELVVWAADSNTLVTARRLNASHQWANPVDDDFALPHPDGDESWWARQTAEAVRRATDAEFGWARTGPGLVGFTPGETRLSDMVNLPYDLRLVEAEVWGWQIRAVLEAARGRAADGQESLLPHPQPALGDLEDGRVYRVAMAASEIGLFQTLARSSPAAARLIDLRLEAVLRRHAELFR